MSSILSSFVFLGNHENRSLKKGNRNGSVPGGSPDLAIVLCIVELIYVQVQ